MTDNDTVTADEWRSMSATWSFSDYGEWLDEGTNTVLQDVASRARAARASRPSYASVPRADYTMMIVHDEDNHTYRAIFGTEQIAYLTYRLAGKRIALWETEVLPPYRDHGVAVELITSALDDIRGTAKKVTVMCPIVRMVIDHYPQYQDLIDEEHPGVIFKHPNT
jgi:predicted GNAT family acetyltransferase